jgi:hypothetical protein
VSEGKFLLCRQSRSQTNCWKDKGAASTSQLQLHRPVQKYELKTWSKYNRCNGPNRIADFITGIQWAFARPLDNFPPTG